MTLATVEFAERLQAYGEAARRAAVSYLDLPGATDHLMAPVMEYLHRPGKGLRPALCMATCEAFGGRAEDVLPSAAALEMLHTAFLVHDDVQDDSELRRGSPTLHRIYGRPLAINAGDGLAVFALGALRDNERRLGRRLASRIWSEFDFMARQTVDGQATELAWQREGRIDLTADDYLDLIMRKTCWYTTVLPLRVGALVGTQGGTDPAPMVRFGFFLGAAFQIRDDILNITGTSQAYGKEPLGDIREGKRTLLLLHLLAVASPSDRVRLESFLRTRPEERSRSAIADVFGMMEQYGSLAFAAQFARGIARSAVVAFEEAFAAVPESPARRFVGEMIPYMVERDR